MSTYGPVTALGTVTSYLPLSTAWPEVAACSSDFINGGEAPPTGTLYLNDPKYASVVGSGAPTCMPPEVSSWWYQTDKTAATPTTYELGGYDMNCPGGYATVYKNAPNTLVTTIGCCPSSYSFTTYQANSLINQGNAAQCYSVLPSGPVTYVQASNNVGPFTTTTFDVPSSSIVWAVQVNGFIFPNPSSTSSASAAASTTTASSSSSTSTAALASNTSPNTSSATPSNTAVPATSSGGGLSTGAKAGIGIGVALGAVGLISLLIALFLFRKRRTAAAYTVHPEDPTYMYQEPMQKDPVLVSEMNAHQAYELGSPKQQYQAYKPPRFGDQTAELA